MSGVPQPTKPPWADAAAAVAEEQNADVLLYNGAIAPPGDARVIDLCFEQQNRPNVIFVLVTPGGSPDAAYRIARCLQETYEKVTLFVCGYCKSAGTLVAAGAHELVFGHHGELGPLDTQMHKPDELWELSSGLTVMEAMSYLQQEALLYLEEAMTQLKDDTAGMITTKTALETAVSLTTGLYRALYEQIDPLHVGEAYREMRMATEYGKRLAAVGGNINGAALERLNSGYASHRFVIDRAEAQTFFRAVRGPSPAEAALADALGGQAREPVFQHSPRIEFLTEPPTADTTGEPTTGDQGDGAAPAEHTEDPRTRGGGADPAAAPTPTLSTSAQGANGHVGDAEGLSVGSAD